MARGNYENCLPITLAHEGGWSDHPKDPGGATMKGVIQRTYDDYRKRKGLGKKSVRFISNAEVQEIYREYWDGVRADSLPHGLDLAVFDAGVNSGQGRANRWKDQVKASLPHVDQIKKFCSIRLGFVRSLKTFSTFGRGWSRRIADIEAKGVAMYLKTYSHMPVQPQLKVEEQKAKTQQNQTERLSKAANGGAAGSVVGAGGGTALNGSIELWQIAALAGVFVVAIAVGVYLKRRSVIHSDRAEAYAKVAGELA